MPTLYEWRTPELHQVKRQQILRNDELAEKVQYWAGQRFAVGEGSVLRRYDEILQAGPEQGARQWLSAAQAVLDFAGIR